MSEVDWTNRSLETAYDSAFLDRGGLGVAGGKTGQERASFQKGETSRGVAALALQISGESGEPLFTWEDVDFLRRAAASAGDEARVDGLFIPSEAPGVYRDLASRLASLLPPRKEP